MYSVLFLRRLSRYLEYSLSNAQLYSLYIKFANCLIVSIGILTGCVINKNSDNMLKADQIVKYPIVRVF